MKESSMARTASAIVVAVAALGSSFAAQALIANSIFPAGMESKVRDRLFMRLGYTSSFMKTKSEDARDITGPVVTKQQLLDAFALGNTITVACDQLTNTPDCLRYNALDVDAFFGDTSSYFYLNTASAVLIPTLDQLNLAGIGTPQGIKAKTQSSAGTPTISLGFWLDEERKWLLEGFVLAAPLSVKIYGDGVRADGTPNSINGRHIATTKLLPPLVIGSYNFGDQRSIVRPYIGIGAMYAIFFDARSTPFFDEYQGGKTTITTKNTFGFGPFVGLQSAINEDWHVNVSVGQIALTSKSRLVTSGTQIGNGSQVLSDLNPLLASAISDGDIQWAGTFGASPNIRDNQFTTVVMELVKRNKGTNDLGTFVREQKMKITNTIVTLSVGRSF